MSDAGLTSPPHPKIRSILVPAQEVSQQLPSCSTVGLPTSSSMKILDEQQSAKKITPAASNFSWREVHCKTWKKKKKTSNHPHNPGCPTHERRHTAELGKRARKAPSQRTS
jgi:hypothetical protein